MHKDDDRVPTSCEVESHRVLVEFREELDHLSDIVVIAEIIAILCGLAICVMVVGLVSILLLTYF
jgi:hypothetical protein